MLVKRKSALSGNINSMEIGVTSQQIYDWENGMLIQNAMPHLSKEEREFIKTGITPAEWIRAFGNDDNI